MSFPSSNDPVSPEHVINVLEDDGCREIIAVLETPMTAQEIATAADVPVSTTYRKLERLSEASLVRETIGHRAGTHHESQYVVDFDSIEIDLDDDRNIRVVVERSLTRSKQQLQNIWLRARHEA